MTKRIYTESQKKAIEWEEGPVVVLAGPGSGKTTVLTERVIRILEETPEESFRILALTFTNKAAAEMTEEPGFQAFIDRSTTERHRHRIGTSSLNTVPRFRFRYPFSGMDSHGVT